MSEKFDVFNSREVLKMQNRKKSENAKLKKKSPNQNYIGTKVFLISRGTKVEKNANHCT